MSKYLEDQEDEDMKGSDSGDNAAKMEALKGIMDYSDHETGGRLQAKGNPAKSGTEPTGTGIPLDAKDKNPGKVDSSTLSDNDYNPEADEEEGSGGSGGSGGGKGGGSGMDMSMLTDILGMFK